MMNDAPGGGSEWVSLRQAADLLGVHPATVRNWADKGALSARRTAGGHRRFHKGDLLRYAEAQGELQPVEVQVIIQNALGQTRMNIGGGHLSGERWYTAMREETRDSLRHQGRQVLEGLRGYIGTGAPDAGLSRAITLGKEYAQILEKDGLSLPEAIRGFLYFSDFVIQSILTWSEIAQPRSPSEWANLLRQVNTFTNSMLLSIIEFYDAEES